MYVCIARPIFLHVITPIVNWIQKTFDNCAVCGPYRHFEAAFDHSQEIHWIPVAWVRYATELIKFISGNWNAPNRKINNQKKSSRPCVVPGANPKSVEYVQEKKNENFFDNMQLHMIISSRRPVALDLQRLERKRIQFAQRPLHARIHFIWIHRSQKSRHQITRAESESERASLRLC